MAKHKHKWLTGEEAVELLKDSTIDRKKHKDLKVCKCGAIKEK